MRADHTLLPLRSRYAYEFADWVYANVLGYGDWTDDVFPDLFEGPQKALHPHKETMLHDVIRNIVWSYLEYSTGKDPEMEVELYQSVLNEADLKNPKWLNESHVRKHVRKLDKLLYHAVEVITPSVFYLLFSDRQFLIAFQGRVAKYVSNIRRQDYPTLLVRDGVIKRPKRLPTWLKAGVFYRDRGRCQTCSKDLTGLGRAVSDLHLDHMIPLVASGSNDPTNFQLMCAACNWAKGPKLWHTRPQFSPYW